MTAPARAVPLRSTRSAAASASRSTAGTGAKAAPGRALLRVVPQRRSQASRIPFAVVLVSLLGGGLLGLLVLNTLVAQGSFALHELSQQSRAMQLREQQLAGQLDLVQAPGHLATEATELGMVPGGPPAFLRLADGKVLGKAAKGKPLPALVPDAAPATEVATTSTAGTTAAAAAERPPNDPKEQRRSTRARSSSGSDGSAWKTDR